MVRLDALSPMRAQLYSKNKWVRDRLSESRRDEEVEHRVWGQTGRVATVAGRDRVTESV